MFCGWYSEIKMENTTKDINVILDKVTMILVEHHSRYQLDNFVS